MNFDDFLKTCDKDKLNKLVEQIITEKISNIDDYFYISEDDANFNQRLYNNIKEDYKLYDYLTEMDPEIFGYKLQEAFDLDETSDLDENFLNDFQAYVADNCEKFEDKFKYALRKFIARHADDPGFNTYGDEYVDDTDYDYVDFFADEKIKDPTELIDKNDKIGDSFEILEDIDYKTREKAFMYLDGKIIEGENGWSHSQVINHYLKDNDQDTISDDYDEKLEFSRPLVKQVKEFTGAEHVGFGHIVDDMAFIETVQNCNVNDVKEALQENYNFKKIYMYVKNNYGSYLQRLAKRLNFKCITR